jgi:predicted metal-dependent phosphotriesterase family hydrolase
VSILPNRRDIIRMMGACAATAFADRLGAAQDQAAFPSGAVIRTVLKDVPPAKLAGGATLFHEHLSLGADFMPEVMSRFRTLLGPDAILPALAPPEQRRLMQDLDVMSEELRSAVAEGVACIVDAGHPDMGRNFNFLKKLSLKSGMPIVAGTGYYTQPFYPPEIARWDEEKVTQELIGQAKAEAVGAFGEIGTWDAMTPDEHKVFRAVGNAHLATNLPIFTHTNMGKGALEQLDVLESVGVDPKRVAIGHLGGLADSKAEIAKAVCKRGAFVGFDRQGGPQDADQVPAVMALLEAGFADKLLFSSDFSFASDLKRNGGAGYAMAVTVFGPKLRDAGVTQSTLHGILVDNPRRFLAFIPKVQRGARLNRL